MTEVMQALIEKLSPEAAERLAHLHAAFELYSNNRTSGPAMRLAEQAATELMPKPGGWRVPKHGDKLKLLSIPKSFTPPEPFTIGVICEFIGACIYSNPTPEQQSEPDCWTKYNQYAAIVGYKGAGLTLPLECFELV